VAGETARPTWLQAADAAWWDRRFRLLFGLSVLSPRAAKADEQVDHKEVWRIVEQTLNHEVTGSTTVEKTGKAFRILQERRRTVAPTDVNLAAAEHYMYMRFLAGKTGDDGRAYSIRAQKDHLLRLGRPGGTISGVLYAKGYPTLD